MQVNYLLYNTRGVSSERLYLLCSVENSIDHNGFIKYLVTCICVRVCCPLFKDI